ncbi:MAG TPA: SynChlorMet cassette protein ScmD [Victivallales bacterium]|nr:SynChlorMet cassette protein ScmD [Victivallales bacterium]
MDLKANFPTVNPMVVFREEFDDWAVLFDPDANETFGLDPVSSFIWKKMDGKHSLEQILNDLEEACEDGIPDDAPLHIEEFVTDLEKRGLIGYEK